jgi:bifunctional N-acetylglucosamine-1-phosphate-uridyltransferase/glucosamine-1-phosphate-acetyltransferase GlmU-like protein
MLTIVVPMAGASAFFPESEYRFPKLFQEVRGRPMVEVVVDNLRTIENVERFVFVINHSDAAKYRLDNVLRMLTGSRCEIVMQKAPTRGAVCSLLLAVSMLPQDSPLLISNADQIITHDLNRALHFFTRSTADAGVVCFRSLHPQWSYARIIDDDRVIETAEKQPISRNAIAGLYYFRRGSDFVAQAMNTIMKDRSHEGLYYTSTVLNEYILSNMDVRAYSIASNEYHSFYSPQKITEYEGCTKDHTS